MEEDETSLRGLIFSIGRASTLDGPGIRSIVFMKGCPLKCIWCHSPESQGAVVPQLGFYSNKCIKCGACVKVCPKEAQVVSIQGRYVRWEKCDNCGKCAEVCPSGALVMIGEWLTVDQLMDTLVRDRLYYEMSGGGVTFSGGEPLFQSRFLATCLKRCKEVGIHTAVDTCGFAKWSVFEEILPYVDLFLYDLKQVDSKRHKLFTGVDNELILENARRICECGKPMWIRIPMIPGYTDSEENLKQSEEVVKGLRCVRKVSRLSYNIASGAKYPVIGRSYALEHLDHFPESGLSASSHED